MFLQSTLVQDSNLYEMKFHWDDLKINISARINLILFLTQIVFQWEWFSKFNFVWTFSNANLISCIGIILQRSWNDIFDWFQSSFSKFYLTRIPKWQIFSVKFVIVNIIFRQITKNWLKLENSNDNLPK